MLPSLLRQRCMAVEQTAGWGVKVSEGSSFSLSACFEACKSRVSSPLPGCSAWNWQRLTGTAAPVLTSGCKLLSFDLTSHALTSPCLSTVSLHHKSAVIKQPVLDVCASCSQPPRSAQQATARLTRQSLQGREVAEAVPRACLSLQSPRSASALLR